MTDPRTPRTEREQVLLAALVKAAVSGCHMTSGGTDGVWCIDHDAPWAEPESLVCSDGAFIVSVLEAADPIEASPLGSSERLAAALEERGWENATAVGPGGTRQIRLCRLCEMEEGLPHQDFCPFAILAADPALDPDAERQRAIGEAVERLPTSEGWGIELAPDGSYDVERGRRYEVRFFESRKRPSYGPTIPAAIAAALSATSDQ
jgi:hypothetical protein